jgi:hypothetical protein
MYQKVEVKMRVFVLLGHCARRSICYDVLWRKKSSSEGPPCWLISFSASCSSKLRNGSLFSGSVCAESDVLAAPGVGCCSYGVGILSMGSKALFELSRFCGAGDGARLAICGRGEKEKLGENGRLLLMLLLLAGGLREADAFGGVKGGRDVCGGLASWILGPLDNEGPASS